MLLPRKSDSYYHNFDNTVILEEVLYNVNQWNEAASCSTSDAQGKSDT